MLVVLVLVSMVSTLLIQGFGYMLVLYQRISQDQNTAYEEILMRSWFTLTNANLMASKQPGESLIGQKSQFKTTTFMPLHNSGGVPTQIQWRFENRDSELHLIYTEEENEVIIFSWRNARGKFAFMNSDSAWVDKWPPDNETLKLPNAIKLNVDSDFLNEQLVVHLQTRISPEITLNELLYGR